jgi:hypothetical protein
MTFSLQIPVPVLSVSSTQYKVRTACCRCQQLPAAVAPAAPAAQ